MIIAPPKLAKPGTSTHALAELLDLYPTIVELAGLPKPRHLEGMSLLPVLKDPAATVKQAAYTQHPRPAYYKGAPEAMGYSMRTADLRYTEWRNWKTGKVIARELYDHRKDPGENHNTAAAQAGVVRKLSGRLGDQFPVRAHP
jgi:iduronate 2-sulfatase